MNFIYISPYFPKTNINFCEKLKYNNVNVLAIGDSSYDQLDERLKNILTEYYKVDSMSNYEEMFKAVAYFSFKYGKIDWLESNNEHWLEQDARLRTDFNIESGLKTNFIFEIKEKSRMKQYYEKGGVKVANYHIVSSIEKAKEFIKKVEYPVITKPNNGVGASDTYKIENDTDLEEFFKTKPDVEYIMEEFITGDILSYDAIVNSNGDVLFETCVSWEPNVMEIVNKGLDLSYYVPPKIIEPLAEIGRKTIKGFGVKSRFVHLEFFRLLKSKEHLGQKGDYVALEVNMRPAGGYTPDMMNYANNTDVYQIWADMVVYDRIENVKKLDIDNYYCVYAGRRDYKEYEHSHDEILNKYGKDILSEERLPELYSKAMGNYMYTAKFITEKEMREFVEYVQKLR